MAMPFSAAALFYLFLLSISAFPIQFPTETSRSAQRIDLQKGTEIFVKATDPFVWSVGRFVKNSDGSLSFDWENAQLNINVQNASFVKILVNSTGGFLGRLIGESDGWEVTSFYVGGRHGAVSTNEFLVANDLYGTRHIRVSSILEPAFGGAGPNNFLTFLGFKTDGVPQPPTPRARKIELIGDSISAGFGSRGFHGAPYGCPVDDNTSGNRYTYNWMLAENFTADLVPIAWSGKGMYENCCDKGITMPFLYLQTLAGKSYSADWDFSSWVPDLLFINLGTNDFGHNSGPAWQANFTRTFVDFVMNATTRYKKSNMPVFVGQGPMNNGLPLYNSLQAAISAVNAAGGNAVYVDMRGPPNDGHFYFTK